MKKTILIIMMGFMTNQGFAQLSQEGTSVLSLSVGKAIAGGVRMTDTLYDMDRTNGQVLSIGYDFFLTDHFSMGFLVANQVIRARVNDTLPGGEDLLIEKGNVNRLYTGVRGMWHYGRGEHVRFYSGFRLGMVHFSTNSINNFHGGESILVQDNNRSRYSLGITPIGMNIFLMENLAIHLETNIGAPGVFFMGANYRF